MFGCMINLMKSLSQRQNSMKECGSALARGESSINNITFDVCMGPGV